MGRYGSSSRSETRSCGGAAPSPWSPASSWWPRKLSAGDPLVPIVLGYVFLMLPWVPGTRIPYIYNYLLPYSFAILALVYWLCRIWERPRWGRWVVLSFAAAALALTLFFLPLATTFPISQDGLLRRVWFDYWFYQEMPVPGSGCYPPASDPRCG